MIVEGKKYANILLFDYRRVIKVSFLKQTQWIESVFVYPVNTIVNILLHVDYIFFKTFYTSRTPAICSEPMKEKIFIIVSFLFTLSSKATSY